MKHPSILWRAILWVERFLPTPSPRSPERARGSTLQWFALLPLFFSPVLVALAHFEGPAIKRAWPTWRTGVLVLLLVLAASLLITVVVAGVSAWRWKTHRDA